MDKYYTPEEVQELCKVENIETVYRWLRESKLRGFKLASGKLWRISSGALDEFLKKGEHISNDSNK